MIVRLNRSKSSFDIDLFLSSFAYEAEPPYNTEYFIRSAGLFLFSRFKL